MLSLLRDVASHEGNFGGLNKKALLEGRLFRPSSLLSRRALDGPFQGLVQLSQDTFIFTLRNASLLTLYFELKQLILELVGRPKCWVRACDCVQRNALSE
jgi:hypothetical protein